MHGTFVYTTLSVDGGRATGELSRVAAPAHGPLGRATGELSRMAAAGIEHIREMCAARCTKGFVDGCRATREFSRVAVPWRGGYTGSKTFGTVFGPVMRSWLGRMSTVGSQRLLVCVALGLSTVLRHLTAHRNGGLTIMKRIISYEADRNLGPRPRVASRPVLARAFGVLRRRATRPLCRLTSPLLPFGPVR